jgi:hypothetical protein
MAELALLLEEVPFADDRETLLRGMQYLVTDPANYRLLDDALPFSAEKELARGMWGR